MNRTLRGLTLAAALLCASAAGAEGGPAVTPAAVAGSWVGARLECRKDASGPVRCGTPSTVRLTFNADGTGGAKGEDMPAQFGWSLSADGKLLVTPPDAAKKIEFFDVKFEGEYLTFQAYVQTAPRKDTVEQQYLHYIYDLAREEAPTPAK